MRLPALLLTAGLLVGAAFGVGLLQAKRGAPVASVTSARSEAEVPVTTAPAPEPVSAAPDASNPAVPTTEPASVEPTAPNVTPPDVTPDSTPPLPTHATIS